MLPVHVTGQKRDFPKNAGGSLLPSSLTCYRLINHAGCW